MKVMIVVTHLLGTGHLARALVLARAVLEAGDEAIVVSGGIAVPHLDLGDVPIFQLPPLRSDGVDFSTLLDSDGQPASPSLHTERRAMLVSTLAQFAPDVLITELFPFGRRTLKDEFRELLEATLLLPQKPYVCASIRDILAPPSKPSKAAFAESQIAQFYDAVLVHSDPEITPLSVSWPVSEALSCKLYYTGFVVPPSPLPHPNQLGADEILVTAGGGNVGAALFATVLKAATQDPAQQWRLLVGGGGKLDDLTKSTPSNVTVEAARPDFRSMLHHAAASVSMSGYNTALDVLQTGCPALFVPFDVGGEVEQTLRAKVLAKRQGISVIKASELTPEGLLAALSDLTNQPRPAPVTDSFDGAANSVALLRDLCEQMT